MRTDAPVCYDTAGSPLLFPTTALFGAALGCVDQRQLLNAAAYPLLFAPRRQSGPDFQPFIAEIEALGAPAARPAPPTRRADPNQQATAACGLGSMAGQRLMNELNALLGPEKEAPMA